MMSSIHIQTDDHQNEIDNLSPTTHPSSMDKSIFVKKSSTSALPSPQYTLETMSSWTSSSSPSSLALQSSLSALVQKKIDNDDTTKHQSSSVDKSIFIKKSNSLPSPQYTLDTMSSWTSSGSPSSLALQSSLSIWPSSWLGGTIDKGDDIKDTTAKDETLQEKSNVNNTKATTVDGLKKWVEDALVNTTKPQSYTTNAREEMCKDQYSNEVTTNRKAWVEETLLSTKPPQSYATEARNEMCKDQNSNEVTTNRKQWIETTTLSVDNDMSISSPVLKEEILNELQQLPSSVSKRCEWLADVTHIKTSTELEDEVRHEFELAKMKKVEEEEAVAIKKKEEEAANEKKMLEEEEERVRVAYEKVAEATRVAEEEERIRNLFATAEMRIKKARQMEKESKRRGLALQLNRQKKKTFSMAVNFDSSDSPVINSKASLKRSRVDDNETIEEGGTKQVQVVGKKRKTLKVKKLVKRIVPKTMRK